MMKFIKEMLSDKTRQISSKRVCGVIGFLACLGIGIHATLFGLTVPGFMDTVLITSAALMGVDSITQIWKKNE